METKLMDPDTPDDFKLATEEPERDLVTPATGERPLYLDHASTTPVLPEVAKVVQHYMVEEFGNAGSRTHEYGARALKAVNHARQQVADVVDARPDDVIFTSGATEANNLAILGLTDFGRESGRTHIISTAIEHKAVLEPLEEMERRGFEVTLIKPNKGGWVEPEDVLNAVR
jgi:cysteine desulfurase